MAKHRLRDETTIDGVQTGPLAELPLDEAVPPGEDSVTAALRVELAATKAVLKQVREERCLDALQTVLEKHRCQLLSLGDGRYQVLAVE